MDCAEAEKRAAAERADAEAAEAVADQVDAEAAEAVVGPQRVVRQPKQSLENLYAYLAHHRYTTVRVMVTVWAMIRVRVMVGLSVNSAHMIL
jgi:hypothetical protein